MLFETALSSLKKYFHHINLNFNYIILMSSKNFLTYSFLLRYCRYYYYIYYRLYILCDLFKTFKILEFSQKKIIIDSFSSDKKYYKLKILMNTEPYVIPYKKTLKTTLLYKQISLNDKTMNRITCISKQIHLFNFNPHMSSNNKNLKIYNNLNITHKGKCFLFFFNHEIIINGVFLNTYYSNSTLSKIYTQYNFLLSYILVYTNHLRVKYYYNISCLIPILRKNIHNLKINFDVTSFLMKNITNYHILFLKKHVHQLKRCFTTTENFIQKKNYKKVNNILNSIILRNYDNLHLLFKKKLPIKKKFLKKDKYTSLNLFISAIIIEDIFSNTIIYKNQLLYESKKNKFNNKKYTILNEISRLIFSDRNLSFYYLNFKENKEFLIAKFKNIIANSNLFPSKRKGLKNLLRKKKNKKKKHNISKKDVRNFFYHINNKRWNNLVLYFKHTINSFIQVMQLIKININKYNLTQNNKMKDKKFNIKSKKIHNILLIHKNEYYFNSLFYYVEQKIAAYFRNIV